ncbi:MAG: ABC transporter permease [Acidobacteriaceae bacterium]|nr:ABC transporter permease [Acidobacteriaceae bacterium]
MELLQTLIQDLRRALRQLRKAPGFAVTAILTLALGIGATTAIFTLVYDVLLRPLPYAHPEQLVVMEEQVAEFRDIYPRLPMNANHFFSWQENSRGIQSMSIMEEASMPLGTGGRPLQVQVLSATPGIFSVLNIVPQVGRAFTSQEAQTGHEHVVLLTNPLWRQQFQSDPAILGRTITLNGFPYTVIGVMPPSFHLPVVQAIAGPDKDRGKPVEAIVPLAFSKDRLEEAMGDFDYFGLARLNPGVSVAQANAEINALQHTISAGLSAEEKGTLSAVLTPFQQVLVGTNRMPLLILLAAVAGLLLVGCINIANLLLARALNRRQQMAVAAALGAPRREMLRISMRETALLAIAGGTLGLLLAAFLVPLMQHYLPPQLDFRGTLHLDWTGAGCALLLVIAAALVAGAVPAWISSATQPHEVLHSESRLASESRGSKRFRRILVAVEVAVSVALVLMTGLLTASLSRLMHTDRGFAADHTITALVNLPAKSYPSDKSRIPFYKELLERLRRLPGVESAGLVSQLPLAGDTWIDMIRVRGDTRAVMQMPSEHFRWISPGYLEAIHLPLLAGRYLSPSDEGKHYALVSELTARTLWPGINPIGRQFNRAGVSDEAPFTVVGLVRDARTISLAKPDPMMVYMPYWYRADTTGGLVVRMRQDPAAIADAIRKTVWSVDPEVSVPTVRALGGVVADSVASRRFEMDLLLLFAGSALLLAGLGVYGVVTYSVVQRQREIGVRLALGAQKSNIYSLVLRDGLAPVLIGAIVGIAVVLASARLVGSLLFQVSTWNPFIVAAAVCVLLAVGAIACLLPARHATTVDPMEALRSE